MKFQIFILLYKTGIMGNIQGIQQFEVSLVSHPIMRNSELFPQKNVMKTTVQVMDQYQIEVWIAGMQKIKATNCPYLMTGSSYSVKSRAMCGNSCAIKIKYDCYPYILMDEIINRCIIHKQFEQNQIWYLLFALSEASNACLSIQGKIGDVRPHNILFNESGQIKILHKFSYPGQRTNFQKTLFQKVRTLLSPEQVKIIKMHKAFNSTNLHLSESFSIGLTLLCALFLEDMSYLYDLGDQTFSLDQFNERLDQLSGLEYYNHEKQIDICYNPDLISLIRRLLDVEPSQRLSLNQLHKWLKPFQKQILNFEQFSFYITDKSSISVSNSPLQHKNNNRNRLKKVNSNVSIDPSMIDMQQRNRIDRDQKSMKSKFGRAYTINQQLAPHFSSPQIKQTRNRMNSKDNISEMILESKKINNTAKQLKIQQSFHEIKDIFGDKEKYNSALQQLASQFQPIILQNKSKSQNQDLNTPLFPADDLKTIQQKNLSLGKGINSQITLNQDHIEHPQSRLKMQDLQRQNQPKLQNSALNKVISFSYKNKANHLRDNNQFMNRIQEINSPIMKIQDAAISANSITNISYAEHRTEQKKPREIIQSSSIKKSSGSNYMQDDELLWKLDQQLNKSKKLFPE